MGTGFDYGARDESMYNGYLYCARDAVMCSYDHWYPDLESAMEDWESEIDAEGWHRIEDTFPGCQDDCI